MRAAYYEELGAARDVLKLGEMETPEPGPGEVRVKLAASGVNPSDWKARLRGRFGKLPFRKIIPHSDGAGVVDAIGDGIDAGLAGQRVWTLNGQWKRPFGTAAEYIVLPRRYVVPTSEHAGNEEAACFGIPFLTAHRAVLFDGPVDGKTLLVQGGAGAVGHQAIQIAKHAGARVITTVSSAEKADYVKAAGADEVVNYRDEDVPERVEALTGGMGADRIVEVDIAANGLLYGRILAPGGTSVIYGTGQPTAQVPSQDFIMRAAALKWFIVYELTEAEIAEGVSYLNQMLAAGALTTTIAARFPLDDIAAAHEMVEAARHMGNVILEIS